MLTQFTDIYVALGVDNFFQGNMLQFCVILTLKFFSSDNFFCGNMLEFCVILTLWFVSSNQCLTGISSSFRLYMIYITHSFTIFELTLKITWYPLIHSWQFLSAFSFWFLFSNELKFVRTNMLSRAAVLVPFFTASKLITFLIFMSFTLSGQSLASDTVFITIGLCNAVIHSLTLLFPIAILLVSEFRVTLARLQVIRILWRPSNIELPYP